MLVLTARSAAGQPAAPVVPLLAFLVVGNAELWLLGKGALGKPYGFWASRLTVMTEEMGSGPGFLPAARNR